MSDTPDGKMDINRILLAEPREGEEALPEVFDYSQLYEEKIAPHMREIGRVCIEYGLPHALFVCFKGKNRSQELAFYGSLLHLVQTELARRGLTCFDALDGFRERDGE